MANITILEDSQGDLVDLEYYCSDTCARTSQFYEGWYGCVELYQQEWCQHCGTELYHYTEEVA